jgi:hypothetical protein
MLDMLAAIFIDAAGMISPKFKEETHPELAEARIEGQHERRRTHAMAAQIDATIDSTMAETSRVLRGLDPSYLDHLSRHRRRYGLSPVME